MISRGVHDGDTVIAEALSLLEKEALGLEREPLAVEEITGDQEGVHVLVNREIDGIAERLTGCVARAVAVPSRIGRKMKCRDVRRRRAGIAWTKLDHPAGRGNFSLSPRVLCPR